MAGSADPTYNPNMQRIPIPDDDAAADMAPMGAMGAMPMPMMGEQPVSMMDWGAPVPCEPSPLVDALIGDSVPPGQPFVRFVSPSGGQADVLDETV
jgi:hypothetical protein